MTAPALYLGRLADGRAVHLIPEGTTRRAICGARGYGSREFVKVKQSIRAATCLKCRRYCVVGHYPPPPAEVTT